MEIEGAFFETSDLTILKNKRIGSGNYGDVYLAQKINDPKYYAAKILKTDKGLDADLQKSILRESLILNTLRHPAILKFLGINLTSIDDPTLLEPTILTEYLSEGSLKQKLDKKDKKLTSTKKYISLIGIADAMRYLHENDVIHRDLKPENILIDENYYPRVCDFGLSRFFPESMTNSKKLEITVGIGTPLYMAPELFDPDCGSYDRSVDVYAFGMIAYELITGEVPFSNINTRNVFQFGIKVMNGLRPEFTTGVSTKMKELIEKCWKKEMRERPTFDNIFECLTSNFADYINEKVDEDEIKQYIEKLKNGRKKKSEKKLITKVVDEDEDDDFADDDDDYEKISVLKDKYSVKYRLKNTNRIAEIAKSPKASGKIFIPSAIRFGLTAFKVTEICEKAFSNSSIELLSFSPKSSLSKIGNYAFENSEIKKIFLPKSLKEVEPLWIKGCDKLSSIIVDPSNPYFCNKNECLFYIDETKNEILFALHEFKGDFSVPEGTTKIAEYSFSNVQGIESFESKASTLKEIGSYSFNQCDNLKSFVVQQEDGELTLFSYCLANCMNLSTVEISCKSLNLLDYCFYNSQLTSLKITDSLIVNLNRNTFKECKSLSDISFQKSSMISIEDDRFSWPDKLKSLSFIGVDKVTLGDGTLTKNMSLENVSIINASELFIDNECFSSSKIKNIELSSKSIIFDKSFANDCISLAKVTIQSDDEVSIPQNSLEKCNSIINISIKTKSKLMIPENFLADSTGLEKVVIGGKIVEFGDFCFKNCQSLKDVEIVESGKIKFGANEFTNCNKLYQIAIKSNLESQVEFGQNCFGNFNSVQEFQLEGGNYTICNDSFILCSSLSLLSLLNAGKIAICDKQFTESKSLTQITMNSQTNITIGNECFSKSEKLNKIILMAKEKIVIGKEAFNNCSSLSNVDLIDFPLEPSNLLALTLLEKSFSESGLKEIQLNAKDVTIDNSCFYNCQSLNKLVFGHISNLTLGSNVFDMCSKIETISIEVLNKLKIKTSCFAGSVIKDAYFQAKSVEIENDAFKNHESINFIRITANEIKLANNVCENCLKLKIIEFEAASKLELGESCFSGDTNLESFKLNGDLITINKLCFYNCNKLNSIDLQKSNQVIFGESTFVGCNNISLITVISPTEFNAGQNCFNFLNKLQSVLISSNLVTLGKSCFENCYLNSFAIQRSENAHFEEKAFYKCTKLNDVSINSKQIKFDDCCFVGCSALKQIKCLSANQINYFETSFDGKNRNNLIICDSATKLIVENNLDTDNQKSLIKLFNKFLNK